MGRDQTRVLVSAAASVVLIVISCLMMDWYRLVLAVPVPADASVAIDLRHVHLCTAAHACKNVSLNGLPGLFPTLAAASLWSSLGVALFVVIQAGARLLGGSAYGPLTRLGYMFSISTISTVLAAAYMFGPETEDATMGVLADYSGPLVRSWAPVLLLLGLTVSLVALYLAVAPESADYGAGYKPITLPVPPGSTEPPPVAPPPEPIIAIRRSPSELGLGGPATGQFAAVAPGEPSVVVERALEDAGMVEHGPPVVRRPLTQTGLGVDRPATGQFAAVRPSEVIERVPSEPSRSRTITGQSLTAPPPVRGRAPTTLVPPMEPIEPQMPAMPPLDASRTRTISGRPPMVAPAEPVRSRTATAQLPTMVTASPASSDGEPRTAVGLPPMPAMVEPSRSRTATGSLPPVGAIDRGPATGQMARIADPGSGRISTGQMAPIAPLAPLGRTLEPSPAPNRSSSRSMPLAPLRRTLEPGPAPKRVSGQMAPIERPVSSQLPPAIRAASSQMPPLVRAASSQMPPLERQRSGPLPPIPDHLRRKIAYVAITAELTGGGLDARREDGSSRLVLWRDVVGVVARRMPATYDHMTFVDIVSTAGSTLRIVPWTRLSGERIDGDGDLRPRRLVERVAAHCPAAKLDPATRHFLETGDPVQIPDLETLQAHDARLA